MKFVHIADIHFDAPFSSLCDKGALGEIRRLDQRKAFKKVINYIKENKIPLLFISGDLFEHEYIKKSTIQYIIDCIKEIPETKIFISPGNHDPFLQNSYYNKLTECKNVYIFNSKIQIKEFDEFDIYGYGFNDFYCSNSGIENIEIKNPEKLNILIMHADLNGANTQQKPYNPISQKVLEQKGFDYIALGHIHKKSYNDIPNQKIVYPGSLISLGFDELGEHGMIIGELSKQNLELQFITLDDKEYIEEKLDISNTLSKEELIETINSKQIPNNKFAKIILIGTRQFEIDITELYKLIENEQIIKIKNQTKINYDLEKIANENTLKGLFAKQMLKQMKKQDINEKQKEILEKATEIAFDVLA